MGEREDTMKPQNNDNLANSDSNNSQKLKSGTNAFLMIMGMIGLLVGLNWLGSDNYGRYDLTEGKVHSLTETSKEAIASMKGLEIRLYLSKRFPKKLSLQGMPAPIKNVPRFIQQLQDRLDEYVRNSDGNAVLTVVQDDLEEHAAALELQPMVSANELEDVEATDDEPQKKYYIGLSLHYGRVEEVLPVVYQLENFEYQMTKSLLRLQDKQRDANVLRDLLDFGKQAHEAVDDCLKTIKKYHVEEDKGDEKEGGLTEQIQKQQTDRSSQVKTYLDNYAAINAQCSRVGKLVSQHRKNLKAGASASSTRSISEEQLDSLVDKIGWFDGMYGAWVASLVNAQRTPASFQHVEALLDHNEIPARTSALRVIGTWLLSGTGQAGATPLAGPLADRARSAIQRGQTDSQPQVRALAIKLAASVNPAAAATILSEALTDTNAVVRQGALDVALRNKVSVDPGIVRPLLKDRDFSIRQLAIVYLGTNNAVTVEEFRPLLDDPDPRVRTQVGIELARMGDVESLTQLEGLLNGIPPQDFRARQLLQESLQKLRDKASKTAPGNAGEKTEASPAKGSNKVPGSASSVPPNPTQERIGDIELPDPLEGITMLEALKEDISTKYNGLKDSPGRKNIGFVCGHEEFCPFAETGSVMDKFPMAANLQNEPFAKRALDDITRLEGELNQFNEVIRRFFLSKGYQMVKVDAGKPIDSTLAALVVYGPRKPFADIDLYHLDQFVLTGKPVVLFMNNYDVTVNQWQDKPPFNLTSEIKSTDTNLDAFLANYGIKNNKDLVMEPERARQSKIHTISVVRTNIGPLLSDAPYSYPLFPKFNQFSETHPLVSSMGETVLPFVSSFSPARADEKGLNFEPLITSTEGAVSKQADFVLDPRRLKDTILAEKVTGPHHVAIHVSGEAISSFFAGRDKPVVVKPEGEDAQTPEEAKTDEPGNNQRTDRGTVNLVVVGSNMGFECLNPSRLMMDFNPMTLMQDKVKGLAAAVPYVVRSSNIMARSFLSPQNPRHRQAQAATQLPGQQWDFRMESLEFLFNVFDWSTGSAGLAQVRSKQRKYSQRDLEVTDSGKREAVRWTLIVGLPVLFILMGLLRLFFRRNRRQAMATMTKKTGSAIV